MAIIQRFSQKYDSYISNQFRKISIHSLRPRKPAEFSNGQHKGTWVNDSLFILDDSFVPSSRFNPSEKNIGEIKEELQRIYGITYTGIAHNGYEADFLPISIAAIDLDAFFRYKQMYSKSKSNAAKEPESKHDKEMYVSSVDNYYKTFKKARNQNFKIADSIAADMQIPIPGLPSKYTAEELANWRSKNHFTWDESLDNGYILIPSIIHSLHSHNGLVGFSQLAFKERAKINGQTSTLSIDEQNAIISIDDLVNLDRLYHLSNKPIGDT